MRGPQALRDIRLESHCEHHMVPIIGRVHVGYLPDKRVVGIITDSDIFKVLVDITGADRGGIQLAFEIPATPGSLRPILDGLRALNAGVISVLTAQKGNSPETRRVYIRLRPLDEPLQTTVVESMKAGFPLVYWEPALKKDADA